LEVVGSDVVACGVEKVESEGGVDTATEKESNV
jgi:hypothetical protein